MQVSIHHKNTKNKMFGLYYWKLVCVGILAFSFYAVYLDYKYPPVCVKSATVKSILSVEGRNATILFDNGETKVVNQATLKPGSNYCLAYERLGY